MAFSETATNAAGIENVTSWPKIGEITVKDLGAWAEAAEAMSAPSAARQMPALVIADCPQHGVCDHRAEPFGFVHDPYVVLLGLVGAIPSAVCSWLAAERQVPVSA